MTNQTITQAKNFLWNEIKEILELERNKEVIREYNQNNKIEEQDLTRLKLSSNCSNDMIDDILNEKIFLSHMPTSYEEMFEWTRQEPLLIYKQIPPAFPSEEETIFCILKTNILNYLKRFVYREVEDWMRDFKD